MAVRRLNEEAKALWTEVFGPTPPPTDNASELLRCVIERTPPLGYERLLDGKRPDSNLVFPTSRRP
jgi:hypothetical protein